MELVWKSSASQEIFDMVEVEFKRIRDIFTKKFEKTFADIHLDWNPRMRSRGGSANWKHRKIKLNQRLLTANLDHLLQTFVHEVCHILAYDIFGANRKEIRAHGREWQCLMVLFGYDPDRLHQLDTSELKSERQKFTAKCNCRTFQIGVVRKHRIEQGRKYRCRHCGELVELVET